VPSLGLAAPGEVDRSVFLLGMNLLLSFLVRGGAVGAVGAVVACGDNISFAAMVERAAGELLDVSSLGGALSFFESVSLKWTDCTLELDCGCGVVC
jgi:hypothetical protein